MGGEFTAQEIAKMAMEEALKKERELGANPFPVTMGMRSPPTNFPPPPPVSKTAFTLGQAAVHVPAPIVKLFKAQITPLAEKELPAPQDLRPFWGSVERALLSLDPSFQGYEMKFREEHVANLGPYILGAKGWAQLGNKSYRTWTMFKREVEEIFGVTTD